MTVRLRVLAEERRRAAAIGLAAKRESVAVMAALAAALLALPLDADGDDQVADDDAFAALVAVGAATAAHCVPALEREIPQARRLGVSDDNLRRVVRIGQAVREVGSRKVDEAADRMLSAPTTENRGDE